MLQDSDFFEFVLEATAKVFSVWSEHPDLAGLQSDQEVAFILGEVERSDRGAEATHTGAMIG